MIKVGLTGNIGSGKSTVAKVFEVLGIPVYHADLEAKKILNNSAVIDKLKSRFGKEILSGSLIDRKKLASIVFNDNRKLEALNHIIHPLVREDLDRWFQKMMQHPYAVQEAAIIFETGFYKSFDKIIMVNCPEELAIKRVMERDGVGKEEVEKRMKFQWESEKKITHSDYVIHNDDNKLIIPQILEIHEELTLLGS